MVPWDLYHEQLRPEYVGGTRGNLIVHGKLNPFRLSTESDTKESRLGLPTKELLNLGDDS